MPRWVRGAVSAVSRGSVRVAVDTSGLAWRRAAESRGGAGQARPAQAAPICCSSRWSTAIAGAWPPKSLVRSGARARHRGLVNERAARRGAGRGRGMASPRASVPATTGTAGAGDCFLAALVWALDRGDAPAEEAALRWGVAAGAFILSGKNRLQVLFRGRSFYLIHRFLFQVNSGLSVPCEISRRFRKICMIV